MGDAICGHTSNRILISPPQISYRSIRLIIVSEVPVMRKVPVETALRGGLNEPNTINSLIGSRRYGDARVIESSM